MWARKRPDIGWRDLASGMVACCSAWKRRARQRQVERFWSDRGDALACLSVRSGFDLLLEALDLPRGSEVLISAITVPDMPRILKRHGLVPIPVDLDIDRLAPRAAELRRLITPATRAIVIAHLFGTRVAMGPILQLAAEHGVLVIEDAAQAFDGGRYRGDPLADVSMFSFGPIKANTALGGGLLRVRSDKLHRRMRAIQADYPVQQRVSYLGRLLKYALLKGLALWPVFRLFTRGCILAGIDYDRMINHSARGFAGGDFFQRIRKQPSAPLLAVLERRLRGVAPGQFAAQAANGRWLAGLLRAAVVRPGAAVATHTYWVFPIFVDDPGSVVEELAEHGFDATQGVSLQAVGAPPDRACLVPEISREALAQIVFLPWHPWMPRPSIRRMAAVLVAAASHRSCREGENQWDAAAGCQAEVEPTLRSRSHAAGGHVDDQRP